MNLFDTHCHLDMAEFDLDRADVLSRSVSAGVSEWMVPATTPVSARRMLHAPWRTDSIHLAAGIHPHEVSSLTLSSIAELDNLFLEFPEIKAVGEAGLDFFYGLEHAERQIKFFESQLELAERYSKPMIVHCRNAKEPGGRFENAYREVLDITESSRVRGVLHSFTGSIEDAERAVEAGWHIGLNGILTFKQAGSLRDAVAQIPSDRILLETDAPYLAPVPMRGKRNEPAFMPKTLAVLAELKRIEADKLALLITQNSRALFS